MDVLKPSLSLPISLSKNIDVVIRSVARMADFLQGGLLTERAGRLSLPADEVSPGATSLPAHVVNAHAAFYAVASESPDTGLERTIKGKNGESETE